MKNSKEYSQKIQKLFRNLKREYGKVEDPSHGTVVEALIYAVIAEKLTESETDKSLKNIAKTFVDFNDLRVSLTEEIVENLGGDSKTNYQLALTLRTCLGYIFKKFHKLNLEQLLGIGKREARAKLEKLEGVTPFVVDYCFLTVIGGHAIPLTDRMIEYMRDNDLVYENSERADIDGFLVRQITAKDGYTFYSLLRKESEKGLLKKKEKQADTEKEKTTKKKTAPSSEKSSTKSKTKKKTTRKNTA